MATKKLTFTELPNRTWKSTFKEDGGGGNTLFSSTGLKSLI